MLALKETSILRLESLVGEKGIALDEQCLDPLPKETSNNHRTRSPVQAAVNLRIAGVRRRRRPDARLKAARALAPSKVLEFGRMGGRRGISGRSGHTWEELARKGKSSLVRVRLAILRLSLKSACRIGTHGPCEGINRSAEFGSWARLCRGPTQQASSQTPAR
jgi:hypothetical protein